MTIQDMNELKIVSELNELTELLDVMTPDVEALREVAQVHEQLDPCNEPLILSMSLFGDSIWGTEYVGQ